jgi:hypothetical protein
LRGIPESPCHPGKQLARLYFESAGQFDDGVQARQPQSALQQADLGQVQAGAAGERHLREAQATPERDQVLGEAAPDARSLSVAGSRSL